MANFPTGVEPHRKSIRVHWQKRVSGKNQHIVVNVPGSPNNQRDLNAAGRLYKDELENLRIQRTTWGELKEKYSTEPQEQKKADNTSGLSYRDAYLEFEAHARRMVESEAVKTKGKKKGWKKTTIEDQLTILRTTWMPIFGHKPLRSIEPKQIQKWINSNCHLSKATLANRVSALRRLLDHHIISPNPCPRGEFRFPDEEEVPTLRYRQVEVEALLDYLKEHDDPFVHLYFTIFRYCGMRTGEILALQWNDIIDGQFLSVNKSIVGRKLSNTTKTYAKRKVYLSAPAREALAECRKLVKPKKIVNIDKNDFIFLNSKGTVYLDADSFCNAWRDAHENVRLSSKDADALYNDLRTEWDDEDIGEYLECKIPYRIPYTLRHTRAAELISQGQGEKGPRELGHSRAMFENTYAEIIDDYKDRNEDYSLLEPMSKIS